MSKNFNQVNLGTFTKRFRHNLRKEITSSYEFGFVQPFYCRFLNGNETISGRINDMMRLAPMPLPTHGDLYKEMLLRFVPAVEVCPFYECIKSQIPYNSGDGEYIPANVPLIDNRLLTFLLLTQFSFASFCYLDADPVGSGPQVEYSLKYEPIQKEDFVMLLKQFVNIVDGSPIATFLQDSFIDSQDLPFEVTVGDDYLPTWDNADYKLYMSTSRAILFRLTQQGRQLRKNLIGLGYSLSFDDTDEVSLLPLLAYYKAYFDTYYPKRYVQWTSTKAFQFVKWVEHNYTTCNRFSFLNLAGTELSASDKYKGFDILNSFISSELARTFATLPLNYVSAHRSDPLTVDSSLSYIDNERMTISSSDGKLPALTNAITSVSLAALRRLSRYASKDSVIGQSLSKWLRIHEGSNVYNTVFSDSNKIGYWRYDFSIDAVYSTSDTATETSGEVLGAYAAKGIGSMQNASVKFTAQSYGFVIGFSSILPEIGFYQGNDPQIYAIDRNTMYQPEFDALGYELTPKYCICDDNGIIYGDTGENGIVSQHQQSFGYIPRYTGLKVEKNIVNGDVSLLSTRDSLSAYHLNCTIVNRALSTSYQATKDAWLTALDNTAPNASVEWQYPAKNDYIGNFNRIFYNTGIVDYVTPDNHVHKYELTDDNFISFTTFEYSLSSRMLPISDSYDCYDDELDNSKQKVENS